MRQHPLGTTAAAHLTSQMPALPNLFTKSSKKKSASVPSPQHPTSPSNTPPSSPEKRSAARPSKEFKRERPPTAAKSSKPSKSSLSRSSTYDPDTHPLNLPPEERYKRLSALSAMSDHSSSADIDREATTSPPPVSSSPMNGTSLPTGNPKPNGTKTSSEGESRPIPPPHRSPTSPASQKPASNPLPEPPHNEVQAEEFKKAGNKFYTSKDYARAVEEYSKGWSTRFHCARIWNCKFYTRVR